MGLIQLSTQGWSPYEDSSGNGRPAVAFTLKKLSGTDVTIYSDAARTTTLATADKVTDPSGRFPGFAAPGEYTLTVEGVASTVQVVAAGGTIRLNTAGGTTDNAAAFATAAALISASTGGTIEFGEGDFYTSAFPSFASTVSVTLKGQGGRSRGGQPTSRIVYAGTAAVDCSSSSGFRVADIAVQYTSGSLAGKLFNLSSSAFASFERCTISGTASTALGCTALISLANAQLCAIRDCLFSYAVCAVRGKDSSGDFSNAITIDGNTEFSNCSQAPIQSGGQAWYIRATFEPLSNGNAGAYSQAVGAANGVTFDTPWMGDANTSGTWIDYAGASTALSVRGGAITSGATAIALAASTFGASITGVHFEGSNGAALAKGVDVAANCTGVIVEGNSFKPSGATIVTAPITLADLPAGSRFQFVSGDNTTPTTYIPGKLHIDTFISLKETTDPGGATTDRVRVFAVVNGSSKTDLDARFETGAAQIVKSEP